MINGSNNAPNQFPVQFYQIHYIFNLPNIIILVHKKYGDGAILNLLPHETLNAAPPAILVPPLLTVPVHTNKSVFILLFTTIQN